MDKLIDKTNMAIILCDSYKIACKAFKLFMQFLEDNEPMEIQWRFDSENCVQLVEGLRYIFIDRRFIRVFDNMKPDYEEVDDFFDAINWLYFYDYVIDYKEELYL